MLQCTLQANGLGFLGYRLASLASVLILDQAGTPVDVNDTALKDLNRGICGRIT